jgi:uncharacterized linocin/CFP29 family protein
MLVKAGFNVNALRTNALLRRDEWKELDAAIIDVAREELNGIADLQAAGLVQQLGGLGTLLSEYEQLGDMSAANVDMAGETPGDEDTVDFTLVSVPVPIVHKDFRLNIRRLEASRRSGDSLDTTQAQTAARLVRDQLEEILFNGSAVAVGGNAIYGYTDFPDRTTGTGGNWGTTIADVYDDLNAMISDAEADFHNGPYGFYVGRVAYSESRAIHTDGSGQSAMNRVLENFPQLQFFKPSDRLVDDDGVLVQMTRDSVDLAVAQNIVTVEWSEMGGMISRFKVMAAMVPRIKSDANSASGVVHYTSLSA